MSDSHMADWDNFDESIISDADAGPSFQTYAGTFVSEQQSRQIECRKAMMIQPYR